MQHDSPLVQLVSFASIERESLEISKVPDCTLVGPTCVLEVAASDEARQVPLVGKETETNELAKEASHGVEFC